MRIEKFISLIQENNSPEIKESAVVPENIHEIKALAKLGARVIGGGIGRVASSRTGQKVAGSAAKFAAKERPIRGIARGISKLGGTSFGQAAKQGAMSASGIEPKGGFFKTLGSEIKKNYGGGKSLQKSVAGRYAGSEQNKDVDAEMRKQGVAAGTDAREKIGKFKQAVGSQIDTTKKNIEQRRTDQAAAKAERKAAKFARSPEGQKQARSAEMKTRVLANIEKSKEARLADPAMDRAMAQSSNRMATQRVKAGMSDAERRDFDKVSAYRAKHGMAGLRKKALEDPRVMTYLKRTRRAIGAERGRIIGNTGRDISNKGRYVGNQPRQT